MPGKYIPLESYLRGLAVDQKEVVLSLEQIEGIIQAKLPSSPAILYNVPVAH
jgi:hypothetical protein